MIESGSPAFQSFLFVPGDRPERYSKALASGADAVILDLEDAVSPSSKQDARHSVMSWVSPDHPVLVRINAPGTPWFADDIKLGTLPGVAGLVLSKAESLNDIVTAAGGPNGQVAIYPLIESAKGMWNVEEIAGASNVRQLLFGTLDFIADMGIAGDGEELNSYRATLALVSRVYELNPPVDGVSTAIDDVDKLIRESSAGKRLGFGGKLCIHPKQVPIVNQCYRPSEAELDWAKQVVDASLHADEAVFVMDGKMIDRPVVLRAQRMLAEARSR